MAIDLSKKNIGPQEKYIRIGAGGLLTVLAGAGVIGAWGFVGLIPLATGLLGSCPVYTLMGKDTNCGAGACGGGGEVKAETHAPGGGCCGGSAKASEPEAPEAAVVAEEAPASGEPAATAEEEAPAAEAQATEEKPAA